MNATESSIRCPICHGVGECKAEQRLYVRGMNRWFERGCRCCQATGRTTSTRLTWYQQNRANEGRERQLFHERRQHQEAA